MDRISDCHLPDAAASGAIGTDEESVQRRPGSAAGAGDGISVGEFLKLLAAQIQQTMTANTDELEGLRRMFRELEPATHRQRPIIPQTKPVVAFWEMALEDIRQGPSAGLYPLLKALTPFLHWMQSPHYRSDNCPPMFLQNYAYFELVGPDGLCPGHTASMGVMLLGPTSYYPPHRHPAAEWLYVLAGRGTWHLANGPTISLPPGAAVYIPHGEIHAFWSMDTPMAAVYLCSGDVTTYPTLEPKTAERR